MSESSDEIAVVLSRYGECVYYSEQLQSILSQTIEPTLFVRDDSGGTSEHLGIKGSVRALLARIPESFAYVAFSDQDDVWFARKIEVLRDAMINAERDFDGPILVHCDAFITDENLRVRERRLVARWARRNDLFTSLMFYKVQGASMMINRPLLKCIKDLPEHAPVYDRYIHIVAELVGRRVFVDRPLMYYRQHDRNAMGAYGKKPFPIPRFLDADERSVYLGNEQVFTRLGRIVDSDKMHVIRDYRKLHNTKNPLMRMAIVYRYLWRYPAPFIKRIVTAWLP